MRFPDDKNRPERIHIYHIKEIGERQWREKLHGRNTRTKRR